MQLVFLNVWGGQVKDEFVEFVKDQAKSTDIFCFQEATDKVKLLCKDILADYQLISDYKYVSENDNFPQVMYVKNGIEILLSGTLLMNDVDCGLAIWAKLKTDRGSFYVCNFHGLARPNDKLDSLGRLRQSSELITFFKDKDEPVIIGGDFNTDVNTESIRMFSENGYKDLIKKFDIDTTRNHFAWDRYPDNKQYFSDYVFLNNKIQCKRFEVPKVDVSDHLPMILEI